MMTEISFKLKEGFRSKLSRVRLPVKLHTNIDANDETLFASPSSFKRVGIFSELEHRFLSFKWKT